MSNQFIKKMIMKIPTSEEVKELRKKAGLTSESCAQFFNYRNGSTWRKKELPDNNKYQRKVSVSEYELLMLISNTHPNLILIERNKK